MAFGLNINFGSLIGNLTNGLRNIAASKIQNLSSMVKTNLINTTTGGLVNNLRGMIGTSLNLNLSKLTGGITFANALKGLPFPSLASLNLNALYGVIDENIGQNLNNFSKNLASRYTNINLDEISLNDKINTVLDVQLDSISSEIEAGIITGKSTIDVLGSLNNLSNTQIRDFSFDPQKQLNFVDNLVIQQKNKIFDLSFNSVSESTIFDNQVNNLKSHSVDSFVDTNSLDFTFFDNEIVNETTISKSVINKQESQIFSIKENKNPLARNIDLTNRYDKEEKTLNYLKFLNDDFQSTTTEKVNYSVSYKVVENIVDPDTNEIIGYVAFETTDENRNKPNKGKRRVQLDENGDFLNYI